MVLADGFGSSWVKLRTDNRHIKHSQPDASLWCLIKWGSFALLGFMKIYVLSRNWSVSLLGVLFLQRKLWVFVWKFCRGKSYRDGSLLLESSAMNQFVSWLGLCWAPCNGSSQLWKQVSPKWGILFHVNNYVLFIIPKMDILKIENAFDVKNPSWTRWKCYQ